MGRLAIIDGVVLAPEDAKVSVYDRGFLYGDSVFETVRTYGGKPFALSEHLQRLRTSAKALGIRLPVGVQGLAREVMAAVDEAGNSESRVRIIISRGKGPLGLDSELALEPLRVVLVEPLEPPPAEQYRDGIAVICVQTVRASDAVHSAKLSNYLASVLALQDARATGAHEALVVNRDGFVVEGTTCNVLAFCAEATATKERSVLCTPPLESGVLAGITRAFVLELATEIGFDVRFRSFTPAQIRAADEVFLTSSIRELLPVVRIDGESIGDGKPGRLTRQLHAAFREKVGLGHLPMPWE